MQLFVKVRSLLRNLFSSLGVEVDLDEEVHAHFEMLTEENIRAGMPPSEAQRVARIELGGIEQVKEQVRKNASAIRSTLCSPIAASAFVSSARIPASQLSLS
jgi:hypothetical protein